MATILLEALITGLLTGSVYALMASGLTLIYGVLGIINVAQGILVILGAYLSYALQETLHLDLLVSLAVTMPLLFLLGVGIQWGLLRRLERAGSSLAILVLFGVGLLIEGVLNLCFGAEYVQLHAWYIDASVQVGSFYLADVYLLAFLLSIVLLTALALVLYGTRFGLAQRAAMQNRHAALLIGIDVERVSLLTFGLGTALAAAGGLAYGATNAFNAASSYDLISRLLVIIVLGGMGSVRGALFASLLMLVIGNVTAVLWSPVWSSVVFFAVLILVLALRPAGLFGQRAGRQQ